MQLKHGIIVILIMATITVLPCSADEKGKENIWSETESRGPGQRPGGGRGPGPGAGHRRFTEEDIDRFLKEMKESNPEKAKKLATLREKDPEKFREELRKSVREQFAKRVESWRSRWRGEFLQWLGNTVPKQARDLSKLKDKDSDLYVKKYELVRRKYWRIFEEGRRNPELAEVLKADLELKERQEMLLKKIKDAGNENEKKQLMSQLEEVVGNKYDLLIRRKQIEYELLLKRLEELQKALRESRDEIFKWKDEKIKAQNVKVRIKELTEQSRRFPWR